MTEHGHKTLRTILWCVCFILLAIMVLKVPKSSTTQTVVEHRRDSANIIVINPTPSQTIAYKDPIQVPVNYDELVKAFLQAVREKEEINRYDSTVYVRHDTDTVGVIPYHITTKGKLLGFSMEPKVINTVTTITKTIDYCIYAGAEIHSVGSQASMSLDLGYQSKNGQRYSIGKNINDIGWSASFHLPLFTRYK